MTREIKLVKEQQERKGFYNYTLNKGYCIHLPDVRAKQDCDRILLEVLHQLLNFVKCFTSKLLSIALFLPPKYILEHHFDGQLQVTKLNPVDGMQVVKVTMTLQDGTEFTVTSVPHKQLRETEQDGYVQLIHSMGENKVFPTPPHTHLTPCCIQPFPPTVSLTLGQKNFCGLKNEFKQQMCGAELQVVEILDDPRCVDDKRQLYQGVFKLLVVKKDTNEKVLKLCSRDHEEVGKDKVKEAAVKEVMEECVLLGIIELK